MGCLWLQCDPCSGGVTGGCGSVLGVQIFGGGDVVSGLSLLIAGDAGRLAEW